MDNDPTSDEPAAKVRSRLRDGARSVSADYERALAGIEAIVDMLPALCERAHTRRATLSRLATEGQVTGLRLPMPAHVSQRGPVMTKIRAAKEALDRLVRV